MTALTVRDWATECARQELRIQALAAELAETQRQLKMVAPVERQRMRAEGYVLRQFWVHPKDWERVQTYLRRVNKRRGTQLP